MRKIRIKKGFTLVELSLSLTFIAILSLTIAFIINDAVAAYRRGITLKQINTTGMGLVDDMRATIQNSSTKSVKDDCKAVYGNMAGKEATIRTCENNGAKNFVTLTRMANVNGKNVPVFGAFCTGNYTYIWNSGYFFDNEDAAYRVQGVASAQLKFKASSSVTNNAVCNKQSDGTMNCSNFKLLKVMDISRSVCVATAGNNYNVGTIGNVFDITGMSEVVNETPVDLLSSSEASGGFALYNLFVSGPAESPAKNAQFYSVSFVLGTLQGNADITKTGNFCATPDDYGNENFDYCAINKFNFAAKATGV